MIDANLLVDRFEETADALGKKGVARETVAEARDLVLERRRLQHELDGDRSVFNRSSREIGELIRGGAEPARVAQRKAEVARLKERIQELEGAMGEAAERLEQLLLRLPNLPHPNGPAGSSEEDNVVVRVEGYDQSAYAGRTFRPHWEVAGDLGIYDAERAAKISGSMFSLLRGEGARLLWALVRFGLDLHHGKYEEVAPPHFVRTDTLVATGHLPKFEADAYRLRDDDLWAIPTGEVPLMSLYRDEILEQAELPRRYVAYTVCFRREAGSAGKDTRGLQRLHEFHKVELVVLTTRERSEAALEELLADAEKALATLGLPYRVVELCTGDLTFSSARTYDLEVYAPGVDRWLEASSVSLCTDFQARRAKIRYRPEDGGGPRLVHSLNASGLATPRVWAAVVEHGQQADGSVRLPEALVPYMGCEVIGP